MADRTAPVVKLTLTLTQASNSSRLHDTRVQALC